MTNSDSNIDISQNVTKMSQQALAQIMNNSTSKIKIIETLPELLIIEDDDLVIKSLLRMTRRFAQSVIATRSTVEGLTLIGQLSENSLVISDIDNKLDKDLSGMDVAAQSWPVRKPKKIPFILVSGAIDSHKAQIKQLTSQGIVNGTVEKPMSSSELYDQIQSVHLRSIHSLG